VVNKSRVTKIDDVAENNVRGKKGARMGLLSLPFLYCSRAASGPRAGRLTQKTPLLLPAEAVSQSWRKVPA